MLPHLSIVIVNWNAGKHLSNCVNSISICDESAFNLENVIVVDNASSDGSIEAIEGRHPRLTILRLNSNLGFAAACNRGASQCTSEYILFLNPDVILGHDSLVAPIRYLLQKNSQRTAVCGIQLAGIDGKVQRSCARIPKPINIFWHATGLSKLNPRLFPDITLDEWDHSDSRYVPHVIGAFYMIRRAAFVSANGFDERYFVYLEDLDLSVRLHEGGWQLFYLASTFATHIGGGTSAQAKAASLFYSLRSRLVYARAHFSSIGAAFVFFSTLVIEPPFRLAYATVRLQPSSLIESIQAYRYLLRSTIHCWFQFKDRSKVANALSK